MKKTINLIMILILTISNCFAVDYNLGTNEQYEAEHLKHQIANGWTETQIAEGKIGVNYLGIPQPNAQRTTKAFDVISTNSDSKVDECIWIKYTDSNIKTIDETEKETLISDWESINN